MKWMHRFSAVILALVCLASASAAQEDNILRLQHQLAYGGAESMDPISRTNFTPPSFFVYNQFIGRDENQQPVPELATEWQPNEDATVWTFSVREGVTFHDGSPLSAADVVWSFARLQETRSPVSYVVAGVTGIEALDELTVQFTLEAPYADLPLRLSDVRMGIVPEGNTDEGIGTGPYMLSEFDPEGVSFFEPYADYWNGTPQLDGIEVIGIAGEAANNAFLAGQIDVLLDFTGTALPLVEGNDDVQVYDFINGSWNGLAFNTTVAPFDDVRVRRAVKMAVDRQEMIDLVLGGAGIMSCDNPVGPNDQYFVELECPQDIEMARTLLAEAGYPDGFEFDLAVLGSVQATTLAEVFQQQMAAIDVTVNIDVRPADGYFTDVWLVEPFIFTLWRGRSADQWFSEIYESTAPFNETAFNNEAFDAAVAEARQTLAFDARRDLFAEAQQILSEEGGAFIPYYFETYFLVHERVEGWAARDWAELEWANISISKG